MEHATERTYTESEHQAALALAYEEAAEHYPIPVFAGGAFAGCACGWRYSEDGVKDALWQWQEHLRSRTPADALRAQQELDAAARQRVVNAQRLALCADLGIEPSYSWGNIVEAWQKLEADNAALRAALQKYERDHYLMNQNRNCQCMVCEEARTLLGEKP